MMQPIKTPIKGSKLLRSWASIALALLLGTLCTTQTPAIAQNKSQERLDEIDEEIAAGKAQVKQYEKDVAQVRKDYAALQKKLVNLARDIRSLEQDVIATNDRLGDLQVAENAAASDLEQHAANMAETLAAMQRLSQTPASTLMAKPEDIDTMARTAILFDAILPALNDQATVLRQKIAAVEKIRNDIKADQAILLDRQATLEQQRAAMATLMADKQRQQKRLSLALQAEHARLAKLAAEAKSLNELIAGLATEKASAGKTIYNDVGRSFDSPPFASAKGRLGLPVPGTIISRFNQKGRDGNRSKGIRVQTDTQAQVTSLWDGHIVFAGPFRDYGALLIISHGQGYHSLLAGMAQIEVDIAQWVLAGEPVGLMNAAPNRKTGNSKPKLYLELRQNGQSIDPLPWIAINHRKVKK